MLRPSHCTLAQGPGSLKFSLMVGQLLLFLCVQVWDLEKLLPILTLQRHEKAVHSLAVWQDSVFTGSEDLEIKVTHTSLAIVLLSS